MLRSRRCLASSALLQALARASAPLPPLPRHGAPPPASLWVRGGASSANATSSSSSVGICFDIDGVFKMGGSYHPEGASLLRKCASAGIPYLFMTNGGGGRTEEEYAAELEAKVRAG